MRLLFVVMLTFAVAALGSVGCGKGKTGTATGAGGTGTGKGGTGAGANGDAEHTFTLNANPAKDVKITQGKDQKVTLTIDRGDHFKDEVKVDLSTKHKDITFDPKTVTFDKATSEQSFKIVAGDTAPVGAFEVNLKGTGGAKTVEMTINGTIEKK